MQMAQRMLCLGNDCLEDIGAACVASVSKKSAQCNPSPRCGEIWHWRGSIVVDNHRETQCPWSSSEKSVHAFVHDLFVSCITCVFQIEDLHGAANSSFGHRRCIDFAERALPRKAAVCGQCQQETAEYLRAICVRAAGGLRAVVRSSVGRSRQPRGTLGRSRQPLVTRRRRFSTRARPPRHSHAAGSAPSERGFASRHCMKFFCLRTRQSF